MYKTKVIFRQFADGDVIALFPEELSDMKVSTCSSYLHVGQHGAADINYVIQQTFPCAPEDYADLKKELENYGSEDAHYHLVIYKRYTYRMFKNREKKFREVTGL